MEGLKWEFLSSDELFQLSHMSVLPCLGQFQYLFEEEEEEKGFKILVQERKNMLLDTNYSIYFTQFSVSLLAKSRGSKQIG